MHLIFSVFFWGIKTIRLQKFQRNIQKLFRFFGRGDDILFTLLLTLVIICSYFIQSFFCIRFSGSNYAITSFFSIRWMRVVEILEQQHWIFETIV